MQIQHNASEKGHVTGNHARLKALKTKHEKISKQIETEQQSYLSDGLIARLKKEKLLIKEEIEGIRKVS